MDGRNSNSTLKGKDGNMLVLSRKKGEGIVIRDDIFITVLEISGNQVRLGIEAPKKLPVHRSEVWVKIQKEKGLKPVGKMQFQVQEALLP